MYLKVFLLMLCLLAMSINYGIVKINLNLVRKNEWKFVRWAAGILLGAIISSWLK